MKKIIFFISCFFVMINTSWALSITCPEVASPGEIIKIYLEEDEYNGIKARYKFDTSFVYQDLKLDSPWKSYYDGVNGFSIGNVSNNDKLSMDISVKVGMNVQLNKSYEMKLINIEGNNNDYKSIDLNDLSCSVKILSNVNTLDSLKVSNVTLSPKFDKNVISYRGTTKSDKVIIRASASDKGVKISGDIGEKKLKIGVNTFVIKVTSPRGNIKEYKIYITRTIDKKSSDVTLKSLTLSEGTLDFKNDTFLYLVDVLNKVENVEVEAIANDSKAKVEIQMPEKLIVGENTINIIVTAEDGTKATYVVIVNRKDKLSSDATIKYLTIKNYDIDFSSDVYEYDLVIDNEDNLDIDVTLSDDKAKYTIIDNNKLKNNSIIKIEVIAEDGSRLIYKIKVLKLSESNSSSIDNYIGLVPVVGFVLLIFIILVVKLIKSNVFKN